MSGLVIQTQPTVEPVSLAEAKLHLRVIDDAQDDVITALIEASRIVCERYCNRAFIDTVYDLTLDEFPDTIYLTPCPIDSVTSITYVDENGTSQTLSSALYRVDAASEPGRITPAYEQTWPSIRYITNAVTVRFKAGYGTAGTDVPETIRTAIKMTIGNFYEHREPVITGTISTELDFSVKALLGPYRVHVFAGALP